MANIPVRIKHIDTQADAESSAMVLLDRQPIRVKENGRIYWGNGVDKLLDLVAAGAFTTSIAEARQMRQMDSTAEAEASDEVLGDGVPIRIRDTGNVYFGDGTSQLRDIVLSGWYLVNAATLGSAAFFAAASFDGAGAAAAAQTAAAFDATTKANAAETNAKAYSDGQVVGVYRSAGSYDASVGTWPTSGTASGGGVRRGDVYKVSLAGTIGSKAFDLGDHFYAVVTNPGQTDANWERFEYNTEQASESMRGTVKIAAQAIVQDDTTVNDTDAVTPKKWWQAFSKGLTIASFLSAVRGTALTGLSLATGTAITAADSILSALGKLQKQITDLTTTVSGKEPSINSGTTSQYWRGDKTWRDFATDVAAAGDTRYEPLQRTLNAQTGTTYTLVLADATAFVTLSNALTITLTVPPNSSVAFSVGTRIPLMQYGAGQVTIAPGSGVTLRSYGAALKLVGQYAHGYLVKIGTNEWAVEGNLTT